jgi:hypothetical protein
VTDLDDKLIPKVLALVNKFGRVATFYEVTKTADDEAGTVTKSAPILHKRKVTPRAEYDLAFINGDTIRAGDMSVILPASGLRFTPVEAMKVEIGDDAWKIVSLRPLDTGEKTAAYKLQLRK